jgi:tetratricopeptide (TPR) repeat protein
LNDADQTINVTWTKEAGFKDPGQRALDLLRSGKISEAIPLLWAVHQEKPKDTDILYNLGVAYSELGQVQKAIQILDRLVDIDPNHVHGLVALGVAQIKLKDLQTGEVFLRRALILEPKNHWALKNLGACLLKNSKPAEAVPVFEAALKANPGDVQSLLGLGQAFEESDRVEDADKQYVKLIHQGGPDQIVDLAKERRTAIAQRTMRDRGSFRPDVMMYITGALEKFAGMTRSQIQAIGFEIAILGQRGLDINDPEQKYSLRTLPGEFSGLHLCSIMYAAFKQFAPNEDVGIDFSREYEAANPSQKS